MNEIDKVISCIGEIDMSNLHEKLYEDSFMVTWSTVSVNSTHFEDDG